MIVVGPLSLTLFPYTTLFRSVALAVGQDKVAPVDAQTAVGRVGDQRGRTGLVRIGISSVTVVHQRGDDVHVRKGNGHRTALAVGHDSVPTANGRLKVGRVDLV